MFQPNVGLNEGFITVVKRIQFLACNFLMRFIFALDYHKKTVNSFGMLYSNNNLVKPVLKRCVNKK